MKLAVILLSAALLMGTTPAQAATGPGAATSVPEPTDAVLLLMGAAGVVIGRKLHARARRKP